mmetsp:Transcript_114568/g.335012  ORF Transcript_114568/g.335012 Transcript_114568/m.335012 type:complete len:237 (-) Transcript_114568:144-854(-)
MWNGEPIAFVENLCACRVVVVEPEEHHASAVCMRSVVYATLYRGVTHLGIVSKPHGSFGRVEYVEEVTWGGSQGKFCQRCHRSLEIVERSVQLHDAGPQSRRQTRDSICVRHVGHILGKMSLFRRKTAHILRCHNMLQTSKCQTFNSIRMVCSPPRKLASRLHFIQVSTKSIALARIEMAFLSNGLMKEILASIIGVLKELIPNIVACDHCEAKLGKSMTHCISDFALGGVGPTMK